MTFLTEYRKEDGRLFAGERIQALDWAAAESAACLLGVTVIGEFTGEIDADLSVGEMLRLMESMGTPPEMQSDIIDIARERKGGLDGRVNRTNS